MSQGANYTTMPEDSGDLLKPGWSPSNIDRYERFFSTLLHGTDWQSGIKYFAICWLSFGEDDRRLCSPMFENDPEKHAEDHLLAYLQLLLSVTDKDRVTSLTIMLNSSPCARCSERIANESALRELLFKPGVEVTIVFSSLHRIRRPSCRWKHHTHVDVIHVDDHGDNLNGLKKLREAEFCLRSTTYSDWTALRSALQLPPGFTQEVYQTETIKRRDEDDTLAEDLEYILKC